MKVPVAIAWLLLGSFFAACQSSGSDSGSPETPANPPGASGCAPGGCAGAASVPPAPGANNGAVAGAMASPLPVDPMPPPQGSGPAAMQPPVMPPVDDQPEPPAEAEPNWEMIVTADWELAPNQERYFCQRVTLKEDIYVSAVKAINPFGTHHTALTAAASAAMPDGLSECNSGGLLPQGIFGSGVGTDPVTYPAGVGLKLRAGQQLLLNLHVFNTSDQPLRGTSGTAIVRSKQEDVKELAESLLAGPARFSLPMGRSSVKGTCTMSHDTKLFAVQPHMHQTGVHMKGVAHSSVMGDVTVHDGPYSFESQVVYEIDDVPVTAEEAAGTSSWREQEKKQRERLAR